MSELTKKEYDEIKGHIATIKDSSIKASGGCEEADSILIHVIDRGGTWAQPSSTNLHSGRDMADEIYAIATKVEPIIETHKPALETTLPMPSARELVIRRTRYSKRPRE